MPIGGGEPRLITDREERHRAELKWEKYEEAKEEYEEALANPRPGSLASNPWFPMRPARIVKSEDYYESPSALHGTKPFIVGEDIK